MPIEATKRKVVTQQQVNEALESLDESVRELERVVLGSNSCQKEPSADNNSGKKVSS